VVGFVGAHGEDAESNAVWRIVILDKIWIYAYYLSKH
jgi:hypothetical protein